MLLNEKETINNSFDVIVIKPLLNHSFDPDQIFNLFLQRIISAADSYIKCSDKILCMAGCYLFVSSEMAMRY